MVCAAGMSSRLLSEINSYARAYGHLEFLEVFFNTLAMHRGLSIWNPEQLSTIAPGMVALLCYGMI